MRRVYSSLTYLLVVVLAANPPCLSYLLLVAFCSAMGSLFFYAIGVFPVWLVIKLMRTGKREPDLPNGPPTVPLLGNLGIFPKVEAHLKYVAHVMLLDLRY